MRTLTRAERAAADPADGAGLDEAKQLGLEGEVHLGDLVEEERAAVGELGGAGPVLGGAGEGAAHVAEDLAFHQFARDGAAIERDEGTAIRAGMAMDRLGAELLAGAALAGDEDRRARRRHAADLVVDRLHRRRAADEAGEIRARGR